MFMYSLYTWSHAHLLSNTTSWCLHVYGSQHEGVNHFMYLFPNLVCMYLSHLHLLMARCEGICAPCMSVDACVTENYIESNMLAFINGYV